MKESGRSGEEEEPRGNRHGEVTMRNVKTLNDGNRAIISWRRKTKDNGKDDL